MTSTDTTTTRTHVWPTLRYRDAPAAIRFLVDAFGFEAAAVYEADGVVAHAELRWPPGGGVMLGSVRDAGADLHAAPGHASIYVVTDEPDALCARAKAAGATIVRGPQDMEYGSREFSARDPEGVVWSFGTYAGVPHSGA